MSTNTSRFATLLGECRREMNGAVVGSMRYFGAEYGLNYGVSLPTLRQLAKGEGRDHQYAMYLYQQQVREIRLISLWVACPEEINSSQMEFWADGIINSEVAEEASFALFQYVEAVQEWLSSENILLNYTALLSLSKSGKMPIIEVIKNLQTIIGKDIQLLDKAVVTLLENYYRLSENRAPIDGFILELEAADCTSANYIAEELKWRIELV